MFRGLRTKIILPFCVLIVGGGVVTTILVSRNLFKTLGAVVDRTGMALAQVTAEQLREPLAYGERLTIRSILTGASESTTDC